MNASEAADKLRATFDLASIPPEDRHRAVFVENVAAELGIAPTAYNLFHVEKALAAAGIEEGTKDYPKMLYARGHHADEGVAASVYDKRNKWTQVVVNSDDEVSALGDGWVENPDDLPAAGPIPVHLSQSRVDADNTVSAVNIDPEQTGATIDADSD